MEGSAGRYAYRTEKQALERSKDGLVVDHGDQQVLQGSSEGSHFVQRSGLVALEER